MDSRQALRKKLRTQRAKLTTAEQVLASQKITEQLIQNPLFQKSQHIAAYISINHEINPNRIIEKIWESHKRCYLPVLQKEQLVFSIYKKKSPLKSNHLNIPEPLLLPELSINSHDLDLVLVPLLGFTVKGNRLGMGSGFYDRTFSFLLEKNRPNKPYLIGLGYECQKLESFDIQTWDVPLNAIITENDFILAI